MSNITLVRGITIANYFEEQLSPHGYHVGLLGSVLHTGQSFNDLDLVVYPHKTDKKLLNTNLRDIINNLLDIGHKLVERDHKHYDDAKEVWKGKYQGDVVDFFFMK